ncbi:hypothetical protein NSMM_300013 [Nitrosomonas mobilis]|uniref:Transposase n=1 Tax=Nitrosomonas mobilis TaxID=51642 RepID=A0A1G5SCG8_9PROT|nr:hypothetical protein NSMM_300013 [Nitrosomonas mobilis]
MNYSATLIEDLPVRADVRRCGIDKNTSFRWRHRFLTLPVTTTANRWTPAALERENQFQRLMQTRLKILP